MSPEREQREAIPAGRDGWGGPERERVAWQRAEERGEWEQLQRRRGKAGTAVGRNAGGRSGTLAPAASLVLLRGRGRMGRTDWKEA